jgi:NitT/TauT family transport system substrate-binding protein
MHDGCPRVGLGILVLASFLFACGPTASGVPAPAARPPSAQTTQPVPAAASPAAALKPLIYTIPGSNANYLPIVLAEQLGYFAEEGLQVSVTPIKLGVVIPALLSGEADFTGAANTSIGAAVKGLPIRVVSVIVSRAIYSLYTKPTIQSFADLKGKTIGEGALTGTQDQVLRLMLKANGLNPDTDVQLLALGDAAAGLAAVSSGAIDAAIGGPPIPQLAERQGLRILGNTADYAEVTLGAVATTTDRITERPEETKGVIRSVLRAIQSIVTQPRDAEQHLATWMGIPLEDAQETLTAQVRAYSRNGEIAPSAMQTAVDTARQEAQITSDVLVTQVFDFSLLREVQPALGLQP